MKKVMVLTGALLLAACGQQNVNLDLSTGKVAGAGAEHGVYHNLQSGASDALEVDQAGVYDLSFLSALGVQTGSARSITATFDNGAGVYEATTIGVDYTGDWSTFAAKSLA